MVRNIVVLGGSSHPQLTQVICDQLGVPEGNALLSKFSVGETRVEINESVRGKDVYIIQSGGGKVNDHLMELLIAISACKTASAAKVTAVLPLFPYSRQSDIPYNKTGAPLAKASNAYNKPDFPYSFESKPQTPHPDHPHSVGLANGMEGLHKSFAKAQLEDNTPASTSQYSPQSVRFANYTNGGLKRSDTMESNGGSKRSDTMESNKSGYSPRSNPNGGSDDAASSSSSASKESTFQPRPGYKLWVAQAGTLVADLLTCAGADHIITMDLHDPQYQGFFDIPVDNLYGRPLLKKYIQYKIPDYQKAVVVSPDAGGAKRATAIADSLRMPFALIHKERRPTKITDRQNATMMLVGDVANRTAILIDDLADTSNTITRAAKLLKKEGATTVIALLTHGVLSGDAIDRINASALDKVVVTNSVPQEDHKKRCPKLEVLDIGHVFAEVSFLRPTEHREYDDVQAIRRVHHGESISVLFQYD
ncbi:ribose-phosphate pyrophosphokinase [Pseudocyphellaria aurata]|nr:ribose-phosphate pyrophosphokinase [Pseudocyphellaria aurata]